MNKYIETEAILKVFIDTLQLIAQEADGEEKDIMMHHSLYRWDFDVHAPIQTLTEEGKELLWNAHSRHSSERAGVHMFAEKIKEIPEAEVTPIIHAQNVSGSDADAGFLCSSCSFGDFGGFHGYEPNYCPNCGAKIDRRIVNN